MTKLVFISDTHNREFHASIPDGDYLIHTGDLTQFGTEEEVKLFVRQLEEVQKTKHFKGIIVVPGNHDELFEKKEKFARSLFDHLDYTYILIDQELFLGGFLWYGSPWTVQYGNWSFMKDELELEEEWNKIPEDVNILLTHTPPLNVLDTTSDYRNIGSKTLKSRIKQLPQLRIHAFGHCHTRQDESLYLDKHLSVNSAAKYPIVVNI